MIPLVLVFLAGNLQIPHGGFVERERVLVEEDGEVGPADPGLGARHFDRVGVIVVQRDGLSGACARRDSRESSHVNARILEQAKIDSHDLDPGRRTVRGRGLDPSRIGGDGGSLVAAWPRPPAADCQEQADITNRRGMESYQRSPMTGT